MKRKSIRESIYDYGDYRQPMEVFLKNGLRLYDAREEYAPLAVLLGSLRALGVLHQSHHWQVLGDSFYGDHLLYERLYKAIVDETDTLGEKVVGVSSPALTNYFVQLKHIHSFLTYVNKGSRLFEESLRAELSFIVLGELVIDLLVERGILTAGIEQAIGNVLDMHESHTYLLQQRMRTAELEQHYS